MVDRDHHYIAESGQRIAAVPQRRTRSYGKSTAVEADQHRTLSSVVESGCPDVQSQAVFAHATGLEIPVDQLGVFTARVGQNLGRDLAELKRVPHPGPRHRLLGGHEAVLATGWRAVRNPLESPDPAQVHALHLAGSGVGG